MERIEATLDNDNTDLLRSRIDQQSELICILKKRADEYISKYDNKEEECRKSRKQCEKLTKLYEEEHNKHNALEKCFFNLQQTREDLVAVSKTTGHQLKQLTGDYETLKESNCNLLKEIEDEIGAVKSLEELVSSKDKQLKKLQAENNETIVIFKLHQESIEASMLDTKKILYEEKDKLQEEVLKLRGEMDQLNEKLASTNNKVFEVTSQLEYSLKQKKDLDLELAAMTSKYCVERKKTIELEETSKKGVRNGKIEMLQTRIEELEEEKQAIVHNFNAYKVHTQELLLQEKSLNSQLRKLKSPDIMRRESTLSIN